MYYNIEKRILIVEHFKPVKSDKEKVLVSVRLNVDILEKIDELSAKADISRNEFIVQCIQYSLKNIKNN